MYNPQLEDSSSTGPTTFQASTADASHVVDRPALAEAATSLQEELPSNSELESNGLGTEGETTVWKGRYSLKNFLVRFLLGLVLAVGWVVLLGALPEGDQDAGRGVWTWIGWLLGAAVLVYWLNLGRQILLARQGHRYELTNRRLFVETGFLRHRRDQVELLRVQDVYVKQPGPLSRLLDIGTVVIESSEEQLPIHYLSGRGPAQCGDGSDLAPCPQGARPAEREG